MECVENCRSINELNQNINEAPNLYKKYLGAAPQLFFGIWYLNSSILFMN